VKEGTNPAGDVAWEVKHRGKKIAWEIGVPNRRATEFALGKDYFHGYGWDNFSKLYKNPLVYTVGKSDPARDWNYAQGAYLKNGKVEPWPWEVRFQLDEVPASGTAFLVVAWASAESARVNFELNGGPIASINPPGGGNALLRESVHAKYSYIYIDIPVAKLRRGANRLVLEQIRNQSGACHVMYDYLALELPDDALARSEAHR
jgi:rhamnogalacturonan endolyase